MYRNADFMRSLTVTPERGEKTAVYANGRLSFEVVLSPGEAWHSCLLYALMDGEQHFAAPHHCVSDSHKLPHAETLADWLRTVLKIRTSNEEFYRLYHQALEDMAALRLPIGSTDHMVFLPAAGLPWFVAPFGRDSLIVSLQNLLIYPEFARGALEILGSLQARERDDYRDAEPGKIPHEMRFGELAHFKLIPAYALLRNGRRHSALSHHAARDLACYGRQDAARAAPGDRREMSVLDRQRRRPRRRRVPGVPDAIPGRLREHGLEGLRRCRGLSGRIAGEGAEGAL